MAVTVAYVGYTLECDKCHRAEKFLETADVSEDGCEISLRIDGKNDWGGNKTHQDLCPECFTGQTSLGI